MLEGVIPRLLACVPISVRRAIIGRPDNPSRIATRLHHLINHTVPGQALALPCRGPLQGYRMFTDWARFRGFVYGTWEPNFVAAITDLLRPGMTAVDVGAHIGFYTLLFAKAVGSSGRVLAFEPLPCNFELLERNIRLNRLDHVQVFQQAAFSVSTSITLSLADDAENSGAASLTPHTQSANFHVPAVALDSVFSELGVRPDFLKIDVEGAEYDVLIGAQGFISKFHPSMAIELHHFDGKPAQNRVPELLDKWGYDVRWLERFSLTSHILATPRHVREQ